MPNQNTRQTPQKVNRSDNGTGPKNDSAGKISTALPAPGSRPPPDPTSPTSEPKKSTRRIQVPNQKINTFGFRTGCIRRRNRPQNSVLGRATPGPTPTPTPSDRRRRRPRDLAFSIISLLHRPFSAKLTRVVDLAILRRIVPVSSTESDATLSYGALTS